MKPTYNIEIGLKSGNKLKLKCVSFNVRKTGDEIKKLEWEIKKPRKILNINLSQIEYIIQK